MNAQNLGAWVAKGQLLDLTPLANRDKYDLRDFWPAKITAATVNGRLMALPSQADDIGVFYNATLFQQASVSFPPARYTDKAWDRQTFLAACQRLTKHGGTGGAPDQFGCVAPMAFIFYAPWIWSNGGDFMNKERTVSTVTEPATIEAFQFLQDLIHKYQVAPTPAQLSTESGDTLFVTGKIGMTTNTISAVTFYRKNATHFTWDVGAIPAGRIGALTLSAGPFWAVSVHSKHPEQSWELSKFLVSAPAQRVLAQGGAEMPSRQSVAREVWQHPTKPPLHGNSFLEGMDYVHPNPFVWNWAQIENMLIKELSYLWDGSKPAQEVMQLIKPQMDALLRQKPS
jgi:multiple sugar transport system substrate-binding protein